MHNIGRIALAADRERSAIDLDAFRREQTARIAELVKAAGVTNR